MSRRLLQIFLGVIATVALLTGGAGFLNGAPDPFYSIDFDTLRAGHILLDSNLRYFSGIWLGVGVTLVCILPDLDRNLAVLRAISLMVFLGGLGRILSIIEVGNPSIPFVAFAVLELLFPAVLSWRKRSCVVS